MKILTPSNWTSPTNYYIGMVFLAVAIATITSATIIKM